MNHEKVMALEEKERQKKRKKGELPPPPHVFPKIKRSNSWQARLRLRNSIRSR